MAKKNDKRSWGPRPRQAAGSRSYAACCSRHPSIQAWTPWTLPRRAGPDKAQRRCRAKTQATCSTAVAACSHRGSLFAFIFSVFFICLRLLLLLFGRTLSFWVCAAIRSVCVEVCVCVSLFLCVCVCAGICSRCFALGNELAPKTGQVYRA